MSNAHTTSSQRSHDTCPCGIEYVKAALQQAVAERREWRDRALRAEALIERIHRGAPFHRHSDSVHDVRRAAREHLDGLKQEDAE